MLLKFGLFGFGLSTLNREVYLLAFESHKRVHIRAFKGNCID